MTLTGPSKFVITHSTVSTLLICLIRREVPFAKPIIKILVRACIDKLAFAVQTLFLNKISPLLVLVKETMAKCKVGIILIAHKGRLTEV